MTTVPIGTVTRAPARVFDRVFRGETILVTRHGRPYVLLSPPPPETEDQEHPPETAG